MRIGRRALIGVVLAASIAAWVSPVRAQKQQTTEDGLPLLELDEEEKKRKQVPQAPMSPAAVLGDTQRLSFLVSPLSTKKLLSEQTKEALGRLLKDARRDPIIKLRAFVAGRGDIRVVEQAVIEEFTKKRLALPAMSVVQVGGLGHQDAQVVLEAVVNRRETQSPHGLAFISGQGAGAEEYTEQVAPLVEDSVGKLRRALEVIGSEPEDVLKVTCFLSSMQDLSQARKAVERHFPSAALSYVQFLRSPVRTFVECEAVARLREGASKEKILNAEGLGYSTGFSSIALVRSPQIVLTGLQMSFGLEEKDARLAFERLDKTLGEFGSSTRNLAMAHIYPLNNSATDLIRKVRLDYYTPGQPPASTLLLFQGLPSLDATFALEMVAARP